MMQTGNPLALASNGRGSLMVELPTGETAYPRAGSLQLSPDGDIVTSDGYIVQPGITVPNDAVSITVNESGEVYVDLDGQVAPVRVGQLELANFANEAGLDAIGQNLLLETAASGQIGRAHV